MFDAFLGMLYEMFRKAQPTWKGHIAHSISLTKATREMQTTADSEVGTWWRHCLKAGFHLCPGHGPEIGKVVAHREVDLPKLGIQNAVKFEEVVSKDGFYYTFVKYCKETNSRVAPYDEFIKEMDQISLAMRGKSIKPLQYEKLVKLHYKTQFGSDTPQWVNLGEPAFMGPVINLGKLEDWKEIQVGQNAVKSKRDDFKRSESQLGLSLSQQEEEEESAYQGSDPEMAEAMIREDTRGVAIRGMQLKDIIRMSRNEDAQDGFIPIHYGEDEIVDEDEQDEEAARADLRNKKRGRSNYISNAADEVEEVEDSEGPELSGMSEEEIAQLIGEGLLHPSKLRK